MKKGFLITIFLLCLTSCGMNDTQSNVQNIKKVVDYDTVASESIYTAKTEINSVDFLSDANIKELDLSLSENKNYLQYKKEFTYKNEYPLSDGRKIVEDKNLYIEDSSGNRKPLIEVPKEETQKFVVFWDMIDDSRFCYYIINHESTDGTGIYNLDTEEDFRIENCNDHSGYVPKKIINNCLFFSKYRIADFKGYGKLNIDTYEFTDIDFTSLIHDFNGYNLREADISPDGTKVVVYGGVSKSNDMNEYQVVIYSLTEKKILEAYNFFSENDYINHQLQYYSDDQVYLYVSQYGDNPKDFLYIIDLK